MSAALCVLGIKMAQQALRQSADKLLMVIVETKNRFLLEHKNF